MAMAEFLRNSAPAMKGRALTGPHDYEQIPELADRGRLRVQRFFRGDRSNYFDQVVCCRRSIFYC